MSEIDSSILADTGTTATVAYERVGTKLYEIAVRADAAGQIIGSRNTYVASDRRTAATSNAWYLTLMNDTSSTFVEVSYVGASYASSLAAPNTPRLLTLQRISVKSGGANATFAEYDTASPGPTLARIKAARRPTSATVIGTRLGFGTLAQLNTAGGGGLGGMGSAHNVDLWDEQFTGEPITLRGQEGIGIQQDPAGTTAVTMLIDTMIIFRVRP